MFCRLRWQLGDVDLSVCVCVCLKWFQAPGSPPPSHLPFATYYGLQLLPAKLLCIKWVSMCVRVCGLPKAAPPCAAHPDPVRTFSRVSLLIIRIQAVWWSASGMYSESGHFPLGFFVLSSTPPWPLPFTFTFTILHSDSRTPAEEDGGGKEWAKRHKGRDN